MKKFIILLSAFALFFAVTGCDRAEFALENQNDIIKNLSKTDTQDNVKTLAFWGDSYCSTKLCTYLQNMLGSDWIVYKCGVTGDPVLATAGRQGGIPMCVGANDHFKLSGDHTQRTKIQGVYSTINKTGASTPGKYKISHSYWTSSSTGLMLNPCVISFTDGEGKFIEVECEIYYDESDGNFYIHRTTDGDDVDVPALATITSYGATAMRNVDVNVCFIGYNGHPDDALLSQWYDRMIEYASSDKFIVVGYNRIYCKNNIYWTQSYHNLFSEKYGKLFLDLRVAGTENVDRLLIESGTYTSLDQKTEADIALLERGEWPNVWQRNYESDIHLSDKGIYVYAMLVYEKMIELGYLENIRSGGIPGLTDDSAEWGNFGSVLPGLTDDKSEW